jgi:hypothetical protein
VRPGSHVTVARHPCYANLSNLLFELSSLNTIPQSGPSIGPPTRFPKPNCNLLVSMSLLFGPGRKAAQHPKPHSGGSTVAAGKPSGGLPQSLNTFSAATYEAAKSQYASQLDQLHCSSAVITLTASKAVRNGGYHWCALGGCPIEPLSRLSTPRTSSR